MSINSCSLKWARAASSNAGVTSCGALAIALVMRSAAFTLSGSVLRSKSRSCSTIPSLRPACTAPAARAFMQYWQPCTLALKRRMHSCTSGSIWSDPSLAIGMPARRVSSAGIAMRAAGVSLPSPSIVKPRASSAGMRGVVGMRWLLESMQHDDVEAAKPGRRDRGRRRAERDGRALELVDHAQRLDEIDEVLGRQHGLHAG